MADKIKQTWSKMFVLAHQSLPNKNPNQPTDVSELSKTSSVPIVTRIVGDQTIDTSRLALPARLMSQDL